MADTTAPTILAFRVRDDGGDSVAVRLRSNEALSTINVALDGIVSQTLARADFTETVSGDYIYDYSTSATADSGSQRGTLTAAADAADNDGAGNEFDWFVRGGAPIWGFHGIGCRLTSSAPTLVPGGSMRVSLDFRPLGAGFRDSTTRYEAARDLLRAAGAGTTVRYGRDTDGDGWFRESLRAGAPASTTVVRLLPSAGPGWGTAAWGASAWGNGDALDGLWCIVTGGEPETALPATVPRIRFDIVPLAPASEYATRSAIGDALELPVLP